MTALHERSAGVIPFRWEAGRGPTYLVLHSATVRNPRARWEFPKGGMEAGETPRETAAREFLEETSITDWTFHDGFERSLSYTYLRRGRKVLKTVTYYLVEVRDAEKVAGDADRPVENVRSQRQRRSHCRRVSKPVRRRRRLFRA